MDLPAIDISHPSTQVDTVSSIGFFKWLGQWHRLTIIYNVRSEYLACDNYDNFSLNNAGRRGRGLPRRDTFWAGWAPGCTEPHTPQRLKLRTAPLSLIVMKPKLLMKRLNVNVPRFPSDLQSLAIDSAATMGQCTISNTTMRALNISTG